MHLQGKGCVELRRAPVAADLRNRLRRREELAVEGRTAKEGGGVEDSPHDNLQGKRARKGFYAVADGARRSTNPRTSYTRSIAVLAAASLSVFTRIFPDS